MAIISSTNVEVNNLETEIIESTLTDKNEDRTFSVVNGEKQIMAIAWGLDEGGAWQVEDTKTIEPFQSADLVVGHTHMPKVKLTARTTSAPDVSYVNATLTYSEP